jgi:hypothetical protein
MPRLPKATRIACIPVRTAHKLRSLPCSFAGAKQLLRAAAGDPEFCQPGQNHQQNFRKSLSQKYPNSFSQNTKDHLHFPGTDRTKFSTSCLHQFAQADKSSCLKFRVEPHDVLLRISDERPVRHNCFTLRLSGIEDKAGAFFAGSHSQRTWTVYLRAIEPSSLTGFEGCSIRAYLGRAAQLEHKSVI